MREGEKITGKKTNEAGECNIRRTVKNVAGRAKKSVDSIIEERRAEQEMERLLTEEK